MSNETSPEMLRALALSINDSVRLLIDTAERLLNLADEKEAAAQLSLPINDEDPPPLPKAHAYSS